jgi:hypothetical protein
MLLLAPTQGRHHKTAIYVRDKVIQHIGQELQTAEQDEAAHENAQRSTTFFVTVGDDHKHQI